MKMVSLSEDDGMEIKMRKHLTILTAAAMTAVMLTACGSGDGTVSYTHLVKMLKF